VRVDAVGAPFDAKDFLKYRGYRWDNVKRYWSRSLYQDQWEDERAWLEDVVYRGSFGGEVTEIPLTENFRGA